MHEPPVLCPKCEAAYPGSTAGPGPNVANKRAAPNPKAKGRDAFR